MARTLGNELVQIIIIVSLCLSSRQSFLSYATTLENGPKNRMIFEGQLTSLMCDVNDDNNNDIIWMYYMYPENKRLISRGNSIVPSVESKAYILHYRLIADQVKQTYEIEVMDSGTYECGFEDSSDGSYVSLGSAVITTIALRHIIMSSIALVYATIAVLLVAMLYKLHRYCHFRKLNRARNLTSNFADTVIVCDDTLPTERVGNDLADVVIGPLERMKGPEICNTESVGKRSPDTHDTKSADGYVEGNEVPDVHIPEKRATHLKWEGSDIRNTGKRAVDAHSTDRIAASLEEENSQSVHNALRRALPGMTMMSGRYDSWVCISRGTDRQSYNSASTDYNLDTQATSVDRSSDSMAAYSDKKYKSFSKRKKVAANACIPKGRPSSERMTNIYETIPEVVGALHSPDEFITEKSTSASSRSLVPGEEQPYVTPCGERHQLDIKLESRHQECHYIPMKPLRPNDQSAKAEEDPHQLYINLESRSQECPDQHYIPMNPIRPRETINKCRKKPDRREYSF